MVNALAARLDVEVDRNGHTWAASFRRGVTGEFAGPGPDADFTRKSGLRQLSKTTRRATGTRIRFWPDRQVFIKDAGFSFAALTERARQTAYLVPGLTITSARSPPPASTAAKATSGRAKATKATRRPCLPRPPTMASRSGSSRKRSASTAASANSAPISAPASRSARCSGSTGSGSFTETIPVLDDRGHMTPTDVEDREMQVDVALQWASGYDSVVRSFVNVIATPHGGTHVTGFERPRPARSTSSSRRPGC